MISGQAVVFGGLAVITGIALFLGLFWASIVSRRENEPIAAVRLMILAVLVPIPFWVAGLAGSRFGVIPAVVLLSIVAAATLLLLIPIRGRMQNSEEEIPRGRIDERDIMFSRAALVPGSPRFEDYYESRPENRAADDSFRSKPGLLAEGSSAYDPFQFLAAEASFYTIEQLRPVVDGEVSPQCIEVDPESVSQFVKRWGKKLGANEVGITELRDYHLYSVVGRGRDYGKTVEVSHRYAIALTVEMDKRTLDSAPLGPAVMESAQQYVASGTIAVQLATFIRGLGYAARAHIDGNYRVVCPLVAKDAGLGELGRMGLLMTPRLGPRVRVSVVTTDLPLLPDLPTREQTVIDFCKRCKKCAEVCPSGAIPMGPRVAIGGVERWQIDSDACFALWCQLGTDCARCVKVCPYSHPDSLLHNLVRRGVRHSALFRRAAVKLDDLLYGRHPQPSAPDDWLRVMYESE